MGKAHQQQQKAQAVRKKLEKKPAAAPWAAVAVQREPKPEPAANPKALKNPAAASHDGGRLAQAQGPQALSAAQPAQNLRRAGFQRQRTLSSLSVSAATSAAPEEVAAAEGTSTEVTSEVLPLGRPGNLTDASQSEHGSLSQETLVWGSP